jgi:ribonuclease HI
VSDLVRGLPLIHTNSLGFQTWIHNWREKDWKTATGKDVKNEGIIRCISKCLDIRAKSGQKVRLQYVRGHSGEVGNEGADRLANDGAFMSPTPELDWKLLEDHLEEILSNTLEGESAVVQGPVEAAQPTALEIPSEPQTQGSTESATSPSVGVDQAADLISQEPLLEASVQVACANPPLASVRGESAEDVNFEVRYFGESTRYKCIHTCLGLC